MAQEAEIIRHIEEKRREIAVDLDALSGRMRASAAVVTNPQRVLRDRPLAVVGAGLALGFVAGWLIAR